MQNKGLFGALGVLAWVGSFAACTSKVGGACGEVDTCPAGAICQNDACVALCTTDRDCPTTQLCADGLCATGNRAAPQISSIDSDGSPDGRPNHGANHLGGTLVVSGNGFSGAYVELSGPAGSLELELCDRSDSQLLARLPDDLAAGDYTLAVTNQGGSCNAGITFLAGETGPSGATGPMPDLNVGPGLLGDGSLAEPLSVAAGSLPGFLSGALIPGDLGAANLSADSLTVRTLVPLAGGPLRMPYFYDDFETLGDVTGADRYPRWELEAASGTPTVTDGKLFGTNGMRIQIVSQVVAGEWSWTWNRVGDMEFWMTNNADGGMLQAEGIGYYVRLVSATNLVQWGRGNAGAIAEPGTASADVSAIAVGAAMAIRVTHTIDGTWVVYINGTEAFRHFSNVHTASAYMGIHFANANGGYLEDLRVTQYLSY